MRLKSGTVPQNCLVLDKVETYFLRGASGAAKASLRRLRVQIVGGISMILQDFKKTESNATTRGHSHD